MDDILSTAEIARYNRHLILPGIGEVGQQKLKNAKVLVVGAGGLGCPVIQYLACAGVGTIGIVDHDRIEVSNLQRQVLYTEGDIGKLKAETAAERAAAMNPWITTIAITNYLSPQNAMEILGDYDVIVDGTDNFPTRYLLNDACTLLNKPLVFGSIWRFEGQVSVFCVEEGPTYRCLYPLPPEPDSVQSCSEAGVLGVLPGIVGSLQANEVIKLITGTGNVLSGTLLVFNALSMHFSSVRITPSTDKATVKILDDYGEFCGLKKMQQVNGVQTITREELEQLIAEKEDMVMIDVREPWEFDEFNIGGSNIPLATLPMRIDELPRNKKLILICAKGVRSANACKLLQNDFGWENLYSVEGGIM